MSSIVPDPTKEPAPGWRNASWTMVFQGCMLSKEDGTNGIEESI